MKESIHIGILSAMPQEIGETILNLENLKEYNFGDLTIHEGDYKKNNNSISDFKNILISSAWSGWGKVSSARAATRMIALAEKNNSPLDLLIFTGVAGAVKENLKQWDIVIPDGLIQHDLDASPLYPKYVIPSLKKDIIKQNKNLNIWARDILTLWKKEKKLIPFGEIYGGTIATGDQFINDKQIIKNISESIKNVSAIEMEGASVAQVSEQEGIPFLVIRVISDNADHNASFSFEDFIHKYQKYSWQLIKALLSNIDKYLNY